MTAALLLVTSAGLNLVACGSCGTKEARPQCCYTKEVCKPAKKQPVYEYHCPQGCEHGEYKMKHDKKDHGYKNGYKAQSQDLGKKNSSKR